LPEKTQGCYRNLFQSTQKIGPLTFQPLGEDRSLTSISTSITNPDGFTWTNPPSWFLYFFHSSITAQSLPPPYSLILSLKCSVTSIQIELEFSSCWMLFRIAIVYYWLKPNLTNLTSAYPALTVVLFHFGIILHVSNG
jgi:hypothetical protein